MKVAVVGGGIAGLGAAYALSRQHEVWVFEREERLGGHTHTVTVPTEAGLVPVDTGFIVHNRENYPLLVRLLEELGVPTASSDMSFACQGGELDWCSRGLNGLFTDRGNLVRPRFWRFVKEVLRFNRVGRAWLDRGDGGLSLEGFLDRHGFSADFREHYLLPMAGAVWSTSLADMGAFPALTLLRFFHNHGMLGVFTQHRWRTIPGGTARYLEPLSRSFRDRIRLSVRDLRVRRTATGVEVRIPGEEVQRFDHLVFACHADQVLPLLEDAVPLEREVLGAFRFTCNTTWLHGDAAPMPAERRAWASWNVRRAPGDAERLRVTYHMNRLQPLATAQDLFVSLNPEGLVAEDRIHRRLVYEHPRFDLAALAAQRRWSEISGRDRLHFAGAYWRYGFHEDGLWSGLRVARALGAPW